jgi:peptidoglycan biosynthesis protein MviN/MurJ (putative lipid II flippase)
MTIVWAVFTLVLFVLEPLFLRRLFEEHAKKDPAKTFAVVQRLHWVLLGLSLLTIAGAVAGSHGWLLF